MTSIVDASDIDLPWPTAPNGRNHALHSRSVKRVIAAMANRLDMPMNNEEMAEIACFSSCHFNRIFRHVTGIPPIQFLYALRLARAKQLLITTKLSVTDICYEVGYNSLGTFISRFHELVGMSPNAFRRFSEALEGFRFEQVRRLLPEIGWRGDCEIAVRGTVTWPADFDGIAFVGLFERAIPEGRPVTCALLTQRHEFRLPIEEDGEYRVFSVGVPWSADIHQLLTLENLLRGRSGRLVRSVAKVTGTVELVLRPPQETSPPILAALPILVVQSLYRAGHSLPPGIPKAVFDDAESVTWPCGYHDCDPERFGATRRVAP